MRLLGKLFKSKVDKLKERNETPKLFRLVEDNTQKLEVRRKAAQALAELGRQGIANGLATTAIDARPDAGDLAVSALLTMDPEMIVVPAIRIMGSNDTYAVQLKEALVTAGEPVVKLLIDAFDSYDRPYKMDRRLRGHVADILGRMGEPAVAPMVRALDHRSGQVRYGATKSLAKIGWEPDAQFSDDWKIRFYFESGQWKRLAEFSDTALDWLAKGMHSLGRSHRENVVAALGYLGSDRAAEVVFQAVEDADEHKDVKEAAIRALQMIDSDTAVRLLSITENSNPSRPIRSAAAKAKGKMDNPKALGADERAARWAVLSRRDGMGAAVEVLPSLIAASRMRRAWHEPLTKASEQDPDLVGRLAKDENAELQKAAIYLLLRIGSKSAVESLCGLLESPHESVRAAATDALGELNPSQAKASLLGALQAEKGQSGDRPVAKALERHAEKLLPKEIVQLWRTAVDPIESTDRRNDGVLKHSEESLPALKALCRIKHPAVSNLLHRVAREKDRSYVGTTFVGSRADFEWEGVLSYKDHRDAAATELATRGSAYDLEAYFLTDSDYEKLRDSAANALKKLKGVGHPFGPLLGFRSIP